MSSTIHKHDSDQNCLNLACTFADTIVYKVVSYTTGITTMVRTRSNQNRALANIKTDPKGRLIGKSPTIPTPESCSHKATESQSKNISDICSNHPSTWKCLFCVCRDT